MKTIVKKGLVALIASLFAVSVFAAQTATTTTLAHNAKVKKHCKLHCAHKKNEHKCEQKCMKKKAQPHHKKAVQKVEKTDSTES